MRRAESLDYRPKFTFRFQLIIRSATYWSKQRSIARYTKACRGKSIAQRSFSGKGKIG